MAASEGNGRRAVPGSPAPSGSAAALRRPKVVLPDSQPSWLAHRRRRAPDGGSAAGNLGRIPRGGGRIGGPPSLGTGSGWPLGREPARIKRKPSGRGMGDRNGWLPSSDPAREPPRPSGMLDARIRSRQGTAHHSAGMLRTARGSSLEPDRPPRLWSHPWLVAVAQLVEPQIVVLVVAGSSPVGHPAPSSRPPPPPFPREGLPGEGPPPRLRRSSRPSATQVP